MTSIAIVMKQTTREFFAAIVVLWVLLTGFFWLGYWVGGWERLDETSAIRSNKLGTDADTTRPGPNSYPEPEPRERTSERDAPARL